MFEPWAIHRVLVVAEGRTLTSRSVRFERDFDESILEILGIS